jgi:hypothetical protein
MRLAISSSSSLGVKSDQALDEVEAHAAHAGRMQRPAARRRSRCAGRWPRRAPAVGGQERVHQRAVVRRRGRWPARSRCVSKPRWSRSANSWCLEASHGVYLRSGRVGKLGARAEHVAMRIDAAGGSCEARLGWAGVPVEPAGRFSQKVHVSGICSWFRVRFPGQPPMQRSRPCARSRGPLRVRRVQRAATPHHSARTGSASAGGLAPFGMAMAQLLQPHQALQHAGARRGWRPCSMRGCPNVSGEDVHAGPVDAPVSMARLE